MAKKIKLKSLLKEDISKMDPYKKTQYKVRNILQKYNVHEQDIANIFTLINEYFNPEKNKK